jgi:hypothetical protein
MPNIRLRRCLRGAGATLAVCLAALAAQAGSARAAASPGFYTNAPTNLAQLPNGSLIRSEQETNFALALTHESVAYRVAYKSTDEFGAPVMVSGMVFLPKGTPPAGGWKIVSWGHGTSGVGDQCAPSKWPDMYTGDHWYVYLRQIDNLLSQGYAVAATDYQGLGTPGVHQYLQTDSLGHAMIDIVRAFNQLAPSTSTTWAAMGHSEGGQAAIGAGELAATYGTGLNYVGAVAYAPPQDAVADSTLFATSKDWLPTWPTWRSACAPSTPASTTPTSSVRSTPTA